MRSIRTRFSVDGYNPTPVDDAAAQYQPLFAEQAKFLCSRYDADLKTLASTFNVSLATVKTWRDTYSPFAEAIREGKFIYASHKVERALEKVSLGYDTEEESTEEAYLTFKQMVKYCGGDESIAKKVFLSYLRERYPNATSTELRSKMLAGRVMLPVAIRRYSKKHHPANVAAIIFWLCNRMSVDWKNVQRQEISQQGNVDHLHRHTYEFDLSKLDRRTLENLRTIIAKARRDVSTDGEGSGSSIGESQSTSLRPSTLAVRGNTSVRGR